MYGLPAPVVIGPLNGGMEFPSAFSSGESTLSRWAIRLGRSVSDLVNKMLPGKLRAAVVLVANERTRDSLPTAVLGRIQLLAENAVDLGSWSVQEEGGQAGHFLFVGRLVDWKALDVVLDALAAVPQATLEIIGDGPMLEPWRAHALANGTAARVMFAGWKSQTECATRLSHCQAMVLPSLYECGGAVVLEAMAMQRPVIATAWGGPSDYLNGDCGILVDPASREALVTGFAEAMRRLIHSPERAREMGCAGRARVLEHFDWHKKIDVMLTVYHSALNRHENQGPDQGSG